MKSIEPNEIQANSGEGDPINQQLRQTTKQIWKNSLFFFFLISRIDSMRRFERKQISTQTILLQDHINKLMLYNKKNRKRIFTTTSTTLIFFLISAEKEKRNGMFYG